MENYPDCGKSLPDESQEHCKIYGTESSNPDSEPAHRASEGKKEKNPYLALCCSFFMPGLGQVYNGSVARGIGFLFATMIGFVFLVIPGVIIWIFGIRDAYMVAEKMNDAELPYVPMNGVHMILFFVIAVIFLVFFAVRILMIFFALYLTALSLMTHTPLPT